MATSSCKQQNTWLKKKQKTKNKKQKTKNKKQKTTQPHTLLCKYTHFPHLSICCR